VMDLPSHSTSDAEEVAASNAPSASAADLRRVRKRALGRVAAVVATMVVVVLMDDPVLLAIAAAGLLPAGFLSLRELRRPSLYLQPTPHQVVARTLNRAAGGNPFDLSPERLAWLQDELDVLTDPRTVKTDVHRRLIQIGGSGNAALFLLVAVVAAVAGSFTIATAFAATGLLLGAGVWLFARAEGRRNEAVQVLEQEIAAAQRPASIARRADARELKPPSE